jgi:hypothetical protein
LIRVSIPVTDKVVRGVVEPTSPPKVVVAAFTIVKAKPPLSVPTKVTS